MDKQKHSNEGESLVIWILTFIIFAFGALTVGSYSSMPPQSQPDGIVKNSQIQPEISTNGLIKTQTRSPSDANTFRM